MWIFDTFFGSVASLLATFLVLLLTWHCWVMISRRRGLPPGPLSLPFVGTMYILLGKNTADLPFTVANLSKKYGDIFSLQMSSGSCIVVITDPQLAKETFGKNTDVAGRPFGANRATSQSIINPLFPKAGIVFSDYDEQLKLQRNVSMVVLRSLGYGKKSIENTIIEEADHLTEAIKNTKGKSFNPRQLLNSGVANIICSLLFDERFDYEDELFKELQITVEEVFEHLQNSIPLDYVWLYRYLPSGRRQLKRFKFIADKLNEFARAKIEEVRETMKTTQDSSNFIAAYLKEVEKSDGKLDDRSHQLVKDFFGAGMDTTSTTLGWVLYFMAKYPRVQDRVRKELTNLLGEGQKPTLKDRDKLPYVEATITEIFRVAPTAVGTLPHYTICDTEIAGYKIPKDTQVQALFPNTVWDPELFPDPKTLKPERHLNADGQFEKNENITPFGVGRRSCLGEQLAKQELFLFFTHLIQTFEFKVPEGETLPPQRGQCFITYRPPSYNIVAVELK